MYTDAKKIRGKKIVTDNPQFRTTDVFNIKGTTERPQVIDKKTVIAVSEKLIDNQIRVKALLILGLFALHSWDKEC
jgi:hypothetical protein